MPLKFPVFRSTTLSNMRAQAVSCLWPVGHGGSISFRKLETSLEGMHVLQSVTKTVKTPAFLIHFNHKKSTWYSWPSQIKIYKLR